MDTQISAIERIDEKGDRTARFAILIIGFTSSALAVGGPGALEGTHPVTAGIGFVGVILLFAAAIAGNATASQTNIPLGAGDALRGRARQESKDRWKRSLLSKYGEWTTELEAESEWNSRYLWRAQAALFLAMVFLLTASIIGLLRYSYGVPPMTQFKFVVGLAGLSRLFIVLIPVVRHFRR